MKIFFSASNEQFLNLFVQKKKKINLLFSNAYLKEKHVSTIKTMCKDYFIFDSGAFTVWKTGGSVDFEAYIKKCEELYAIFGENLIVINLDVIPGSFGKMPTKEEVQYSCEKSFENYQYMKSRLKCKIMPVFHQHEDFSWLQKYIDDDCFLLGISPANDVSTKGRKVWLHQVFYMTQKKKRCHGLAATSQDILQSYPWWSVDSSSVFHNAGFGGYMTFENGNLRTNKYKSIENFKRTGHAKCVDMNGEKNFMKRVSLNIDSFTQMEEYITKLWELRGVTWAD